MSLSALVTGATSGIGRALVGKLRERGVSVYATGRDAGRLAALCDEFACVGSPFDLKEPASAVTLYRAATAVLGKAPDILVNNAGYNSRKALWVDVSDEELDAQWNVNLRAPAILCREAMRDMSERRAGHIVNVLSTVVLHGAETMGTYSAMKHGLHGLTRVLVKEARPHGVKVTAVYPGGTDTSFRDQARPDYLRPESVAHMICDVLFSPPDVVVHELVMRPLVETNF